MKQLKILAAVSSVVLLTASSRAEVIERIVAKVNGDIITWSEYTARQVAAAQAAHVAPGQVEAFLRKNNAKILQEAIDEQLIIQRADALGLKLRSEYIQKYVDDIKKENGITSDAQLREQLRAEGLTIEEFKRNIEHSILRREVIARELQPKVTISEDEALSVYQKQKATAYTHPATVHLQEILVKGAGALERAKDLAARARAGEDFGALAKANSAAPSAPAGGDLGQLARGDLNPEIGSLVFSLEPGGVSDPIPAPGGVYQIFRVEGKTEAKVVPFAEVKAEIVKKLSQERMAKAYDKYVADLRKDAVIDVRVREVPLQVDVPKPGAPEPGLQAPGAPPSGIAVPEFSGVETSPQAGPEHVVPPSLPGETPKTAAPTPTPAPSPSPTPPAP